MDGKKINELMLKGAKIKIVNTPNKKHEKSVLEFRIFINNNTFFNITKFQALKHLSNEQKRLLNVYDYVISNVINAPFNIRLNWNVKIQDGKKAFNLSKDLTEQMFIHEAITQKKYLELQ